MVAYTYIQNVSFQHIFQETTKLKFGKRKETIFFYYDILAVLLQLVHASVQISKNGSIAISFRMISKRTKVGNY